MRYALTLLVVGLTPLSVAQTPLTWESFPGEVTDISVAVDGNVWAIGADTVNGGSSTLRWDVRSRQWRRVPSDAPGGAVRVTGGIIIPFDAAAAVVNDRDEIFLWFNGQWNMARGGARGTDVGVGADGSLWLVGNGRLFRWNGSEDWTGPFSLPADERAQRIAVGPMGHPWAVSGRNRVYRFDGVSWDELPSDVLARDIDVDAAGTVRIVGLDGAVHAWDGTEWRIPAGDHPEGLVAVASGPRGHLFAVDSDHRIHLARPDPDASGADPREDAPWQPLPGAADDIAVGANGSIWAIGAGGFGIYRWDAGRWSRLPGGAARIAAGHVEPFSAAAAVVNNSDEIFLWFNGRWNMAEGGARGTDVGIGADGSLWVIGGGQLFRWNGSETWTRAVALPGGLLADRLAVGPAGDPWVVLKGPPRQVFRLAGNVWEQVGDVEAEDIDVGADGTAWVVRAGGNHLRWTGSEWVPAPPEHPEDLTTIAVGPTGKLLGITEEGSILAETRAKLTREELDAVLDEYAPVLVFSSAEPYKPTSVEWFLERVDQDGSGRPVEFIWEDGNRPFYRLALDTLDEARRGSLADAQTYIHVKADEYHTDVQWWFFYAFNGPAWGRVGWASFPRWDHEDVLLTPCGQHEGDWEHITLRINHLTREPDAVFLAQHGTGQWIHDTARLRRDPAHPGRLVVFPSLNGHATYPFRARYDGQKFRKGVGALDVFEFWLADHAPGNGEALDTRGRRELISAHFLDALDRRSLDDALEYYGVVEPAWFELTGRWGIITEQDPSPAIDAVENAVPAFVRGLFDFGLLFDGSSFLEEVTGAVEGQDECNESWGPEPPFVKGNWLGGDCPAPPCAPPPLVAGSGPGSEFVRGECNDDGEVNISDALCLLGWLFLGGPTPGCLAAANTNGDEAVNISDPVALLGFLFLGGPPPVEPFPDCGPRPEGETLGCDAPPAACR